MYLSLFGMFSVPFLGASHSFTDRDASVRSARIKESQDSVISIKVDSTRAKTDSLPADSTKKKGVLDAVVDYTANDSIVLTAGNWGYLYGDGEVKYTTITLKAENIAMNMDSSVVAASYGLDSIGEEFGYPVFSDGGTEYESKTMKYNFKTKKGYSRHTITEQGEGYVVADQAKKTADDAFFMQGGKYTTCDDHDHPHFYLALTKAKVKPQKNIVTGPAYLVIEDLPIPFIGLPFGYFPFSEKYSSGVIMPSPGDEMERGFFLRDGGYYFAINDNIDLALTGEIYTKGSWGLNARSSYKKRYKYSGSFNIGYLATKTGDKGLPDYSLNKASKISWTHSQDPKANMYRTLSASVNFSTNSYDRSQLNSLYNATLSTQATASSTVNLTQRLPNSPWSFSASMSVNQNLKDSSVSMTLPNMTITMSRLAPFKRKEAIGPERWYEKIQMSYSGEIRNSIKTKEDKLLKSSFNDWEHAMKHSIPISATFSAFNYLNITPSFNYTERWYTQKFDRKWDPIQQRIEKDTTGGFHRVYDFNAAISMQTKLYGFFTPVFSKSTVIRHVFTPSVSLSYAPDFSDPRFGYYNKYYYYDANGDLKPQLYGYYEGAMFGTPGSGKQGVINFDFQNNIEMKYATADTLKKVSLIDNLGIGFSYNMMADSMKWSDIATNIRLKLSKSMTVNLNMNFDTYAYDFTRDSNGNIITDKDSNKPTGLTRVNKLRISHGKGFGRLRSVGYSLSPSINQDTFKKWFGGGSDEKEKAKKPESSAEDDDLLGEDLEGDQSQERKSMFEKKKDDGEYDADGYTKNSVKWSLSAQYSFNYAYNTSSINEKTREYNYKLTHNLGFSGSIQPTKNWSFNFSSGYDFENKAITYLNCNLTRNLHCWAITASFIPVGFYKSYFISLRANSSMLQDLKYEKRGRSSSYDPAWD